MYRIRKSKHHIGSPIETNRIQQNLIEETYWRKETNIINGKEEKIQLEKEQKDPNRKGI